MKIHDIRDRCYKVSAEECDWIWVFRIICENRKEHREKTGEKVQYTLTILPEFLFPHSRIPFHDVLHAIGYYVKTDNSNYPDAALLMHCINPLSFKLYYLRFLKVLDGWIMLLVELTLIIGGTTNQEGLSEPALATRKRIVIYEKCAQTYFNSYAKLPGNALIADEQGYLNVLFCKNRMGLGP